MNKDKQEQIRQIKADSPLSVVDGAPRVVTLDCGVSARLPASMDYRILNKVQENVADVDDEDATLLLVYFTMHTTEVQIAKLWQLSRKPKKLYNKFAMWLAAQDAMQLAGASAEIMEFIEEYQKEVELSELDATGGSDSDAKKKTT